MFPKDNKKIKLNILIKPSLSPAAAAHQLSLDWNKICLSKSLFLCDTEEAFL